MTRSKFCLVTLCLLALFSQTAYAAKRVLLQDETAASIFSAYTDADLAQLVSEINGDGVLPQDVYEKVEISGSVTSLDPLNEKLRWYNGSLTVYDTQALTDINLSNLNYVYFLDILRNNQAETLNLASLQEIGDTFFISDNT